MMTPLVDDDIDKEEAIKVTEKKNLENDIEDETLKVDEIVNIKESKNHLLGNVIGNLNQRTLKSQAQNQSNFFCFISTIEPKNVNEALKDESWIIAMQEELNQFMHDVSWEFSAYYPKSTKIIGSKWVYRNKLDENGVVSRNKARSKPMKTPMSSDMKLTKDEECESVDSTKYRGMIGSLLYLMASRPDIMFSVCLCARFQEDPKTSHLEAVIMPRVTASDHKNTRSYIPKISNEYTPPLKHNFKFLENRYIHEGWVVYQDFDDMVYLQTMFGIISFDCLFKISEQIVPRFILEFYSQFLFEYNSEGHMFVKFVIQNKIFSLTLEEFGRILDQPIEGQCSFTDKWSLDYLESSVPSNGPYQTTPPTPNDIKLYVQVEREEPLTHEEEAIKVTEKKNLENDIEDETLEIDKIVNIKESRNHPLKNVMGNLNQRTFRSQAQNQSNFFCFISTMEPKNVNEALTDESWIIAMQEELNQFVANDVWELVPQPKNMTIIGTKWVFKNKLDENGVVSRNKARLVAQGYNQQEGINYVETSATVAKLKSIRILLAYACALYFKLF
ncbi:retrovirus-related pol polyprotein from transposon TNT 1-94 [Tanacetum coccineum]